MTKFGFPLNAHQIPHKDITILLVCMNSFISGEMKTSESVSSPMLPHIPANKLSGTVAHLVRCSYCGNKSNAPRTPNDLGTLGISFDRTADRRLTIDPNPTWALTASGYLQKQLIHMSYFILKVHRCNSN